MAPKTKTFKSQVFIFGCMVSIPLYAEWAANGYAGDSLDAVCAAAWGEQLYSIPSQWCGAWGGINYNEYSHAELSSPPFARCIAHAWDECDNGATRGPTQQIITAGYVEEYRLEDDSPPATCNKEGNPCDVITGKKTEFKEDYSDAYISFGRYYESQRADPVTWIGSYWRHSFDVTLDRRLPSQTDKGVYPKAKVNTASGSSYSSKSDACLSQWASIKNDYMRGLLAGGQAIQAGDSCNIESNGSVIHSLPIVRVAQYSESGDYGDAVDGSPVIKIVSRPAGGFYSFKSVNGHWWEQNNYAVELDEIANNYFEFRDGSGLVDTFVDFALTKRLLSNGDFLSFAYTESGRLETITHSKGEIYTFSYNDNDQIETFTHPNGSIGYRYDANYNLEYVDYEDGSSLQYHYEDQDFVHHLTGITDEKGVRYATWSYDSDGRVINSEHAGVVEHVSFDYQTAATVVTDHANGGARIYHLGFEGGKPVVTHITGDKCPGCFQRGAQNRLYDTNGHDDKITDWEGNVTDYDHNDRGLEVSRTEGLRWDSDQVNTATVTTPETRTITTEWHPKFRLETRISEPEMVTDFVYDCDNGRLLEKKVWDPAQAPAYVEPVCS